MADAELSNLAQGQQATKGSDDSQQIIKTLTIINYLKVTVLVIIGMIIMQQIYYRLFAGNDGKGGKRINKMGNLFGKKNAATRRQGQRPITRAEALLVMLENNGCPPEQLQTLRNTVQNQDVKAIPPEDFTVEQSKYPGCSSPVNFP